MIAIIAILLIVGLAYPHTLVGKLCLGLMGLILLCAFPFATISLGLLVFGGLVVKGGQKGLGVTIVVVGLLFILAYF